MNTPAFRVSLPALGLAALMSACGGGGDTPESPAMKMGAEIKKAQAASPSIAALAAANVTVEAKALFDWAQYVYPDLFPKDAQGNSPVDYPLDYLGVRYTVRSYANGNNLGLTSTGEVYGLGPFTADVLTGFGRGPDYASQVQGASCQVYAGSCTVSVPLNQCADPAAARLTAGNTSRLVYDYSGSITGDHTVESLVNGASTFEGQAATKVTSNVTSSTTVSGFTVNSSVKVESFLQLGANGVTKTLGSQTESISSSVVGGTTIPVSTTRLKTVYNPARDNLEFYLQPGQGRTVVNTSTTTSESASIPASTGTSSSTYTYEGVETITVFGKSYNTCRYRTNGNSANSYSTSWFIVGKGVPAKVVNTEQGVVNLTQQLKSGTYNGAPL